MFYKTIETERLLLRPFTPDDIQSSFEIDSDPEVVKYTHDGGVKSLDTVGGLIKNFVLKDYELYGFGRFAVEWKETGEFIGFSGLKNIPEDDEVDLGYRFKRTFWGKGIATESSIASLKFGFEELNLKEITALVLKDNTGSINVLKKLNFQFTEQFYDDNELVYKYILKKANFNYL